MDVQRECGADSMHSVQVTLSPSWHQAAELVAARSVAQRRPDRLTRVRSAAGASQPETARRPAVCGVALPAPRHRPAGRRATRPHLRRLGAPIRRPSSSGCRSLPRPVMLSNPRSSLRARVGSRHEQGSGGPVPDRVPHRSASRFLISVTSVCASPPVATAAAKFDSSLRSFARSVSSDARSGATAALARSCFCTEPGRMRPVESTGTSLSRDC